jgi:thiol-disulfide isomerase/thioredoxin
MAERQSGGGPRPRVGSRGPFRRFRAIAFAVAAVVGLASCGSGAVGGGSSTLPGPRPDDVTIAPEQTDKPRAPAFSLALVDGTVVDVSTLWTDRPLILFFFASWCGECATQQDRLNALVERYGDALPVVGIAGRDTPEDVAAYIEDQDVRHPVGLDGADLRIWLLYAAREPPLVAVVGPGGRLLAGYPGGADQSTLDTLVGSLVTLD